MEIAKKYGAKMDKIGYVAYWIGFLNSLFYLSATLYLAFVVGTPTNYLYPVFLLSSGYFFLGWAVKFIVTRDKRLLPLAILD